MFRKTILVLSMLLGLALTSGAQTWTQEPKISGSKPFITGYTSSVYDPVHHFTYMRGRDNPCGDPFTNNDTAYFTTTNTFTEIGWSGGGASVGGVCVQPIVDPDPTNYPGDRHPYHQYDYDSLHGFIWMTAGVEDAAKCDDSGNGICSYKDLWSLDLSTHLWTAHSPIPFPLQEGATSFNPDLNQFNVFGGLSAGATVNWMSSYDVVSDTWHVKLATTGTQPPIVDAPGMVYVQTLKKYLVFGGGVPKVGGGFNLTNIVYLFDPSNNSWSTPAVTGTVPPGDKFPKMYVDTLRNRLTLYVVGSGVYTLDFTNFSWTFWGAVNGPQLINGLMNSLYASYDSDTDTGIFPSTACHCVWFLNFPPVQKLTLSVPSKCSQAEGAQVYSCQATASGGAPPYKFSLQGNVPSWLSINQTTGLMTGMPNQSSVNTFTVFVSDSLN